MARISKDDETRTYVLRLDRSLPEASQTRWVYRLPTDADTSAAYKAGNQRVRGGVETDPVAYNFALCARVLVDVQNLFDADGNVVAWPASPGERRALLATLSRKQPQWFAEIANAAAENAGITDDERLD